VPAWPTKITGKPQRRAHCGLARNDPHCRKAFLFKIAAESPGLADRVLLLKPASIKWILEINVFRIL
jgi:hypothetical protein